MGGQQGFRDVQGYIQQAGAGNIGSFRAVQDLGLSDSKAVVELSDLVTMSRILKELGPDAFKNFKKKQRNLGKPAQRELRQAFGRIGIHGPLGAPKRKGRHHDKMSTSYDRAHLSFMRAKVLLNTAKGIDINYKDRKASKNLSQLKAAKDGTISIVRLRVRAPALIVADMAGKSNKARKSVGSRTRPYDIDLFGRGVRSRPQGHVITARRRSAITTWLDALDSHAEGKKQNEASRYAWPTMVDYMPEHKAGASRIFNETIQQINDSLGR
jgi:hypothetical protein